MDIVQITGIGAAIFTTAANIPQAIKIIRTGSTKSISSATYFILVTGTILWTVYGILKSDWPIILCNGISALLAATVLIMKLRTKKQGNQK